MLPVFIFRSASWSFLWDRRSRPFRGTGLEMYLCLRVSPQKVLVTSLVLCLVNIFGRFFPPQHSLSVHSREANKSDPSLSGPSLTELHFPSPVPHQPWDCGKLNRGRQSCKGQCQWLSLPQLREPEEKQGGRPQSYKEGCKADLTQRGAIPKAALA